ncbi:MAG TPA: circadian clock protein KaiC [Acidimicrobiales bacterium]
MSVADEPVHKLPTGIRGLDPLLLGGLPAGRPTLVAGTTGSGKTVMAAEFLARGILTFGAAGVFVTFEESPADLRANIASLGFDVAAFEADGRWAFVDASAQPGGEEVVGDYDLAALVARVAHAVASVGATRVVLDSIGAVFSRYSGAGVVRRELVRVIAGLRELGVTALITAERTHDYDSIARFGVEEFVADNVVLLRNVVENEKRRRTIEILKLRGAPHRSGEFSFTIVPREGISVMPLALISLREQASTERVALGPAGLDAMLGGGVFRDSVSLGSGPTGIGKTLVATSFAAASAAAGERCLLVSFEESTDQLHRNAASWGLDLAALEAAGLLRVVSEYPEVASLEDHFVALRQHVDTFGPRRVAIDNLSALERISTTRGMRDFVIGFGSYVRSADITTLLTSSSSTLVGTESVTEVHASTLTDAIVLLRYVELASEVRRAVCVLKVRGAVHDTRIHEFRIDDHGMQVGEPFTGVSGILAGSVVPSLGPAAPSALPPLARPQGDRDEAG